MVARQFADVSTRAKCESIIPTKALDLQQR